MLLRHLAETELLKAVAADGESGTAAAYRQLRRIKDLRRGYEENWEAVLGHRPASSANAVFLSSTYADLKSHRTELRDMIKSVPMTFIGMEEFYPNEKLPIEFIRDELNKAGIYLGVFGMRYGSIDPATKLSMTELEYRQAVADKMKLCVFLMADDAPITVDMVERDVEGFAKMVKLKQELLATRTCGFFHSMDDLTDQARDALKKLQQNTSNIRHASRGIGKD